METVKTTCYKDKNDRLHLSQFIIMLKSHHRKNQWLNRATEFTNTRQQPLSVSSFTGQVSETNAEQHCSCILSFVTTCGPLMCTSHISKDSPHWTHCKIWDGLSGISFFPCCKRLGYGFQRSLLDTHSNLLISVMWPLPPKSLSLHQLCPLPLVPFSSLLAFPPFIPFFNCTVLLLNSVGSVQSLRCSSPQFSACLLSVPVFHISALVFHLIWTLYFLRRWLESLRYWKQFQFLTGICRREKSGFF